MSEEVVNWLNKLPGNAARQEFHKCCAARWWCVQMNEARPFAGAVALQVFGGHPKIGDLDSLRMRLAGNKQWSAGEQAGVEVANEETLQRLADGNREYEQRFGYVFIVCATGKTAAEMLALLESRLRNDDSTELSAASEEQRKITHLRLGKLTPSV